MTTSAKQQLLARFPTAEARQRSTPQGQQQYRIAQVTGVRVDYLSGWCSSEEHAWQAALQRLSSRDNNKDHW